MVLPYKIASLLYVFDPDDRVLLLERARDPNRGLWSPAGGKLDTAHGESPHAGACREAREELGLDLSPADLHLTGLVSENGYQGQTHWLMFLFEVRSRILQPPPPHAEGRFALWHRDELGRLPVPDTDREQIWPLFWRHRNGFFMAHCDATTGGAGTWTLLDSRPASGGIPA